MPRRGKSSLLVIWKKLQTAHDSVVKPELPGACKVAHRRGEDAVIHRLAVWFREDAQLDFIRLIRALPDHHPHMRAIVELFHLQPHLDFLFDRRLVRRSEEHTSE